MIAAVSAQEIPCATDAYRIVPVSYDGSTGILIFTFDDCPFNGAYVGQSDMDVSLEAYNSHLGSEVSILKSVATEGGRIHDHQLMMVDIGYNITRLRIVTDIGSSAVWNISPVPLATGQKATATPCQWKYFWVLKKYVDSGDADSATATGKIIDTGTYEMYKGILTGKYDDSRYISLPIAYSTTIN